MEIGTALSVDTTLRNCVRVCFFPEAYKGNLFKTDVHVYNAIGIYLQIEVVTPRARSSVLRPRPPAPRATAQNVDVQEVRDVRREAPALVITFNAELDLGPVHWGHLLPGVPAPAASMEANRLVANASEVRCGRFKVNFAAIRSPQRLPSAEEVYEALGRHLGSRPLPRAAAELEGLRRFALRTFHLEHGDWEQMGRFQLILWEATRRYLFHRLRGAPTAGGTEPLARPPFSPFTASP